MWWPIFLFGACGLEHVVANMSFIPLAIFHHAPGISVGLYIWKGKQHEKLPDMLGCLTCLLTRPPGIIPSLMGNIIGGAGFCGAYYYWFFIFREADILVDGTYYDQPALVTRTTCTDAEKGQVSVKMMAQDMNGEMVHMRKPTLSDSDAS